MRFTESRSDGGEAVAICLASGRGARGRGESELRSSKYFDNRQQWWGRAAGRGGGPQAHRKIPPLWRGKVKFNLWCDAAH
jgi:hypothetical protein